MSQNSLRGNLSSARFPFLSTKMGRSIILPQFDQNYDRTNAANTEDTVGKGIPQVYYMHNVMPTVEGYQSVGYKLRIPALAGAEDFDQVFAVRDGVDNTYLYSPASGLNYVFNGVLGIWESLSPFTPGDVYARTNISYAFMRGEHYICVEGQGVYQYIEGANTFTAVTFAGLVMTALKGICTSSGYLLAYDADTVYRSSLVDPLDFAPSLITGAGSDTPTDAKGQLVTLLQIAGGFICYTTANAVSGQYTGNVRFPFTFKEVVGSGGLQKAEQVSYVANFAEHYAITSSGLQKLDRSQAVNILDDATDFLTSQTYESFDTGTLEFSSTKLARQVSTKLVLISNRYLVISYGLYPGQFSYAIVYDLSIKRWGKLKIEHADCFEFNWPNLFGPVTYAMMLGRDYPTLYGTAYVDLQGQQRYAAQPKTSFAFLQATGAVYTVDLADNTPADDSVLVIGKYQHTRNRLFTLQECSFDNLDIGQDFAVYALASLDGKNNQTPVAGYLADSAPDTAKYNFSATGINVSILVMGTFNLNTMIVNWTNHGRV